MSDYRRLYQPGGSYFFTIVTHHRIKMFSLPDNITRLKSAFGKVMKRHPFTMEAFAEWGVEEPKSISRMDLE
jgi:putative transposase